MARKRMISFNIIDSDNFLRMPPITQNLYYHLSMRADDDGFVDNPRTVVRIASASEEDLDTLVEKGYLIPFENGVMLITHWLMHNTIRKNRYVPTQYQEQLAKLTFTPGGAYSLSGKE